MNQVHPLCGLIHDIHIGMATCEPNFFNVTDGGSGTSYIAAMGVHLPKVLRDELDSTFIKSKCMSDMASVCHRCRGGDVDIPLDETQRRHCIPGQSQLRVLRRARRRDSAYQTPTKWILTSGQQKLFLNRTAKFLFSGLLEPMER